MNYKYYKSFDNIMELLEVIPSLTTVIDIDKIIISYLNLDDYITLLKINIGFKKFLSVKDVVKEGNIFIFMKELIKLKEITLLNDIIKEFENNNYFNYRLDDHADQLFDLLIESEEIVYDFVYVYIYEYIAELNDTMEPLYDVINDENLLNIFIKKLFYHKKSHLAKRIIDMILSIFCDNGDFYNYYTFIFRYDKHFNSYVVEEYLKIVPNINLDILGFNIRHTILHDLKWGITNDVERKYYIHELVNAGTNSTSKILLYKISEAFISHTKTHRYENFEDINILINTAKNKMM